MSERVTEEWKQEGACATEQRSPRQADTIDIRKNEKIKTEKNKKMRTGNTVKGVLQFPAILSDYVRTDETVVWFY